MALSLDQAYVITDQIPASDRVVLPQDTTFRLGGLRLPNTLAQRTYGGVDPYDGHDISAYRICLYRTKATLGFGRIETAQDARISIGVSFDTGRELWIAAYAGNTLAGFAPIVSFEPFQQFPLAIGTRAARPAPYAVAGWANWTFDWSASNFYDVTDKTIGSQETGFFGIVVDANAPIDTSTPPGVVRYSRLLLAQNFRRIQTDGNLGYNGYYEPVLAGASRGPLAGFLSERVRPSTTTLGRPPANYLWDYFNRLYQQADIVDLVASNLPGMPSVDSIVVITEPGRLDSDGVRQPDPFALSLGYTQQERDDLIAEYYPVTPENSGWFEVLRIQYTPELGGLDVTESPINFARRGGAGGRPAIQTVTGLITEMDVETILAASALQMDGNAWTVNAIIPVENGETFLTELARAI